MKQQKKADVFRVKPKTALGGIRMNKPFGIGGKMSSEIGRKKGFQQRSYNPPRKKFSSQTPNILK